MGGSEFFKPIYYLPAFPPLLLAGIGAANLEQGIKSPWASLALANLLGLTICFGVATLVLAYKERARRRFGPWSVLAVAVFLGLTKAFTTAGYLSFVGIEENVISGTVQRAAGAVTAAVFTIITLSVFGALRLQYSAEREKLALSYASRDQSKFVKRVLAELDKIVEDLLRFKQTGPSLVSASLMIDALIEHRIKPLCREAWFEQDSRTRAFDIKSLARQAVFSDPYPAKTIALTILVISPLWQFLFSQQLLQVAVLALQALIIWCTLALLNDAKRRLTQWEISLATLLAWPMSSAFSGFSGALIGVESPTEGALTAIFLMFFLPSLVIVFGVGSSFFRAGRAQTNAISAEGQMLGRITPSQQMV